MPNCAAKSTNTEVTLAARGALTSLSCASGPAFEGAGITHGMRAMDGAVERVRIDDLGVHLKVVGNARPVGICGSGIIDLVSVLLQNGFIDRQGTFTDRAEAAFTSRDSLRGREIIISGEEAYAEKPLVFNQEDIRQVQLARSAIRTAIEIMMNEAGIDATQLDYIFLAGTFGTFIDPASVTTIGVVPPVDLERIKNIGNAAADGAIMALLWPEEVQAAEELKTRVKHIELALHQEFQNLFLSNLDF